MWRSIFPFWEIRVMLNGGDVRQANSVSDKTVLLYNETDLLKLFLVYINAD